MTTVKESERSAAIDMLRESVSAGDTLYTILRHVSASGMQRQIDIVAIRDNDPRRLTWYVARAGIASYDNRYDALKVNGAGMDMGFHVVYSLSRGMFPDGFGCIGEGCPSNDHVNGDRDYTPHVQQLPRWDYDTKAYATDTVPTVVSSGHWHKDGGYALRHRWL